jgi:hypothetical protein
VLAFVTETEKINLFDSEVFIVANEAQFLKFIERSTIHGLKYLSVNFHIVER